MNEKVDTTVRNNGNTASMIGNVCHSANPYPSNARIMLNPEIDTIIVIEPLVKEHIGSHDAKLQIWRKGKLVKESLLSYATGVTIIIGVDEV
jgi:hypothetical protein